MKHNCHPHELYAASNIPFENQTITCYACTLPIFGTCYACSPCNFYLHKFCFDQPQSAHFPSHPKHALTLLYPPYCNGSCDECGEPSVGFTYSCNCCKYNIHASCANLLYPKDPRNEREVYTAMVFKSVMSALKVLKGQLMAAGASGSGGAGMQQMEADLARRRHEMHMAQIKRSSDSITYMGQIGTNNYTVRYI